MRSYFKEMYCNLDIKQKVRRSKQEIKEKSKKIIVQEIRKVGKNNKGG